MKQTDRTGVNAVEAIFVNELGWIFREQTIADHGIDAEVEVTNNKEPMGRLLALQIKSGTSYFKRRGENYVYYGEGRHRQYWKNHSLPVVIVLHNPETKITLWQRFDDNLVRLGAKDSWSIEIPPSQILNADAREGLEKGVSDITAFRRLRMTLDLSLMREFADNEVYFSVEEWPNKSLGIRDVQVFFGQMGNKEPEYVLNRWFPTHSIGEYFAAWWPWLSYTYADDVPECDGSIEMESHELHVELNELGEAFLKLEQYYEEGAEVVEPEINEDDIYKDTDVIGYVQDEWLSDEDEPTTERIR